MANGKFTLGKQSGGTLGLVFPDGVSDTEVVLPESGNITSVNTAVTDNALARYDGTTGKLQNSRVIVDDSGNVGIGVTPNSTTPGYYTLQMHGSSGLALMSSSNDTHLSTNSYYNSGYRYQTSGVAASDYSQSSGAHYWRTAPVGTAGSAMTWTNAMTLNSSGNLLIGTATDNGVDKLQVNGSIKCSNGSKIGGVNHSIVVYNEPMSYPATAIHFKFNYRPLTIDKMICLRLSGYNYGSAESFNATVSCYVYTGTAHLNSLCTTDSRVNFYISSDGYLTLKVALTSSVYYPSFVIDSILTPMGFVESSNLLVIQASSSNI